MVMQNSAQMQFYTFSSVANKSYCCTREYCTPTHINSIEICVCFFFFFSFFCQRNTDSLRYFDFSSSIECYSTTDCIVHTHLHWVPYMTNSKYFVANLVVFCSCCCCLSSCFLVNISNNVRRFCDFCSLNSLCSLLARYNLDLTCVFFFASLLSIPMYNNTRSTIIWFNNTVLSFFFSYSSHSFNSSGDCAAEWRCVHVEWF